MEIRTISASGYNLWADICEEDEGVGGGFVQIEPGWQLIATPVEWGFWNSVIHEPVHDGTTVAKFENYIYDQIVDKYGTGKILVANTFLGDVQAFYSYVPEVTPTMSKHNFQLIYLDNSYQEISGYWICSLHSTTMTIQWGTV